MPAWNNRSPQEWLLSLLGRLHCLRLLVAEESSQKVVTTCRGQQHSRVGE